MGISAWRPYFPSKAFRNHVGVACILAAALGPVTPPALALVPSQWAFRERLNSTNEFVANGEQLLHGVRLPNGNVSHNMPMASLQYALLCNHAPAFLSGFFRWLPILLVAILTFALAFYLFGSPFRALAASIFASAVLVPILYDLQLWYADLVLLVACFSAALAERPSSSKSAAWGASIGLSVLYRSPLVFLLPAFWLDHRLRRRKGPRWGAAAAAFVIVLLPWVLMNWSLFHEFVLLERGEGHTNVIGAVAAYTAPHDAQWPAFLRSAAKTTNLASIFVWAAGLILRHPWGYFSSLIARARYLLALQPVLLLLAAVSAWQNRRSQAVCGVALISGYFLLIHLPIVVFGRYMAPLWPLAAALAAGCWRSPARASPTGRLVLGSVALPTFAFVSLFGLFTLWKVSGLGLELREATRERLAELISSFPDDPWPIAQLGKMEFAQGRDSAAFSHLRSAMVLGAGDQLAELDYDWLLSRRGWDSALLNYRSPTDGVDFQAACRARMLKSLVDHRIGREREAIEELGLVAAHSEGETSRPELQFFRASVSSETWNWIVPLLERVPSPSWPDMFPGLTENERAYLTSGLARAGAVIPTFPGTLSTGSRSPSRQDRGFTDLALAAYRSGRRAEALRLLDKAFASAADDAQRADIAQLYGELGDPHRSLKILSLMASRDRGNFKLRLWQAIAAESAGSLDVARRALTQARELARRDDEVLELALVYQDLALAHEEPGDIRVARSLFDRISAQHPNDAKFAEARRIFLSATRRMKG